MKSPFTRTKIASLTAVLLVAGMAISVGSAYARIPVSAYAAETSAQRDLSLRHTRKFLKLAQTHADICLQNEQQCLQGCDGATSCSNQCGVNYQGCMNQGG